MLGSFWRHFGVSFLELFDLPCRCVLLFSRVATVCYCTICARKLFHCHGDSVSGSNVLGCRVCFSCFLQPCWQRRFKTLATFSGASLWLLRPSLVWCFLSKSRVLGCRVCSISACFFAAVLATSLLAHLEKLQRIRLRLFRRFFVASPSFTGNVLPCPGALFCATVSAFQRVLGKRAGNVVSSCFGKVSDETLGLLSVLLCGFSVLHWHGVSLSGSHALGCRVCFPCFLQTCWQRRF